MYFAFVSLLVNKRSFISLSCGKLNLTSSLKKKSNHVLTLMPYNYGLRINKDNIYEICVRFSFVLT